MQRGPGILQHSFTMGRRSVGKEHLPFVTDITAIDFHCGGQGGDLYQTDRNSEGLTG